MNGSLSVASLVAYLVGLAAAGSVLVAIVRRPQNGLLLLAALTPFNGLLIVGRDLGIPAWWKEFLLFVTGFAALVAVLTGRAKPTNLNVPWWPAVALLMVYGTVSAVNFLGAGGWVTIKIAYFYVGVVIVMWLAPFMQHDRDRLVTIIIAVGAINAVVGIAQQFVGVEFLVRLGYRYGEEVRDAGPMLRSFGTFNQPFPYGLYLMMTILVGLSVSLAAPQRLRSRIFFVLLPILIAGMAVSMVRASYLGLALGLLWIGILKYRKLLVGTAAAGALAIPLGLLLIPADTLAAVFSSNSFTARTSGWDDSWNTMLNNPFGQGLGAVGAAAEKITPELQYITTGLRTHFDAEQALAYGVPYQPDNYYIKLLLEIGPIGLWLFILFIATAFMSSVHVTRNAQSRGDSGLAAGISAFVLVVAIDSVVATYLEIFPIDMYTWLFLGVLGCIPLRTPPCGDKAPATPAGTTKLERAI